MSEELVEAMARGIADAMHAKWPQDAGRYRRRAQAALAALKANGFAVVQGWQDIASAPRDGTPLLLRARCKTATASARVIGWYIEGMGWIELAYAPNHPVGIVPEMWMPLPAAPLASSGEA